MAGTGYGQMELIRMSERSTATAKFTNFRIIGFEQQIYERATLKNGDKINWLLTVPNAMKWSYVTCVK